jgi:hypothetical protein
MANATQLSTDLGDTPAGDPARGGRGRNGAGGHFLLSKASRDFTLAHVDGMTRLQVHNWFVTARWGNEGVQVCPECGTIDRHYWIRTRWQWRCKDVACGRFFSVTSGTKFADHKLPLKYILRAMLIFVANVKGISACSLARQLGVAYQTGFVLLHKLREAITDSAPRDQLDGLVHVDGAHVSGRARKPRVKVPTNEAQARDRIDVAANPTHPNRRIVIVMRKVSENRGIGGLRTIVEVTRGETAQVARALAKKYIAKGAKVHTDEHPAYGEFQARYEHETVNHSTHFATDEGVSNNQAESYFSRMRRMVIGQVHRVTPRYMVDYAREIAWREDHRRSSPSILARSLAQASLSHPCRDWTGYWQGNKRAEEDLFEP